MSSSVTRAASGSPSWSVSVVPSSSLPSHGIAKLTRTLSCGIVTAALQPSPPSTIRCTPFDSRIDGGGGRILEPADAVEPRPGRVDDRAGPHRDGRTVDAHLGARAVNRDDLGVVQDDRATVGGGAHIRHGQPRVVRPGVGIERRGMQALGAQLRDEPERAGLADTAVQLRASESRVQEDARAHEPGTVRAVAVEREDERQPVHEMRCDDVHQCAPLLVRLAHQPDVAHLEVAQPAMDQLGGGARGCRCEVAALDERHVEPVRARGLGDAGADDPATDHEQIEVARAELA